ncbi:Zn-dependent hydrolase, including glyoxylase [Archaeoglobus sulfaticallidus PM70-1]|uniref:Zn-dependent hydrolase, including glyoxylase n=1 Tax=Archaeoglobus sulfaticallidus PM70-1 TaxID=387631 RepID=N0BLW9_9EURY|nr:MBL fold metallo-hydrolase [Archaeoglobus sulfaticallidus]AGK61546.1 Zn-dependent hydrolase, including glyoxylase [Archaeoglobus sulfaticallidus PM70-1]
MGIRKLEAKGCNVYLLNNYLIDTGTSNSGEMILKQISDEKIDGIIITHAHLDHIGSAGFLQRELGCKVYAHELDIPYILGDKKLRYSGFLGILVRFGERLFKWEPPEEVEKIDKILDVFEVGESTHTDIAALHTPGHTPGSICLIYDKNLICGDLLRDGKLSNKSFCSDYEQYLHSVRAIMDLDFELVYSGHGRVFRKEEIKGIY